MAGANKPTQTIDEALHLLDSKLEADAPLEISSYKFSDPVPTSEVKLIEEALQIKLPKDYVDFITQRGLFVAIGDQGKDFFRMLSPKESLVIIQNEFNTFNPEVFGTEPDELKQAQREHLVRMNLYPIQYISHYVSDFYCYFLKIKSPKILDIYHDDFDLADWILETDPKFAPDQFPENFDDHFIRIISSCIDGKY